MRFAVTCGLYEQKKTGALWGGGRGERVCVWWVVWSLDWHTRVVPVEEDAAFPLGDVVLQASDVLTGVDGADVHNSPIRLPLHEVDDRDQGGRRCENVRFALHPQGGALVIGFVVLELFRKVLVLVVGAAPAHGAAGVDFDAVGHLERVQVPLNIFEEPREHLLFSEDVLATRPAAEVAGKTMTSTAETGLVEAIPLLRIGDANPVVAIKGIGFKEHDHSRQYIWLR